MKVLIFVILSLALLSKCESTKKTEVVFKHDLVQEVVPGKLKTCVFRPQLVRKYNKINL